MDVCRLAGWMKSGDDSGKAYSGTIEIPNLSEEHSPEDVDVTVLTSDSSACAAALKDFIRVKGVDRIRQILGQYISDLKQGKQGWVSAGRNLFLPCHWFKLV